MNLDHTVLPKGKITILCPFLRDESKMHTLLLLQTEITAATIQSTKHCRITGAISKAIGFHL
jgi:hypothetical protein